MSAGIAVLKMLSIYAELHNLQLTSKTFTASLSSNFICMPEDVLPDVLIFINTEALFGAEANFAYQKLMENS